MTLDEFYASYDLDPGTTVVDALLFIDPQRPVLRSAHLAEALAGLREGPTVVLDYGCGGGALLKEMRRRRPEWSLFGHDLRPEPPPALEGEFEYLRRLPESREFDLICLNHVLEHAADPAATLRECVRHLRPGGLIFVEVPYYPQQPFDLVIYDHLSHFTHEGFRRLAGRCALVRQRLALAVPREMSVLFHAGDVSGLPAEKEPPPRESLEDALRAVGTLAAAARCVREAAAETAGGGRALGVFGTGPAAVYLSRLGSPAVRFLVDTNPRRVGRRVAGLDVLALGDVPEGSVVVVSLPTPYAFDVVSKVQAAGRRLEARLF
jgi:SAM-dependent methyltransferase